MPCEGCPNRMPASGKTGTLRPGEASVALTDDGGLICAYWTSDGERVGSAEFSGAGLAGGYPELAAGLGECRKPLTAMEARALGKPALDGACRPLTTFVGDGHSGDAVAEAFSAKS